MPAAGAEVLADRVPGARLVLLPGVRHGCVAEGRTEVARHVLQHLAA
ncbi:hypothetical protein GCM10025868_11170 [Angustibacter aerolatus]|uniref:Peptidase S33 tripeptidyl aminopeptidase-like C-terminal domain-containing protein n=1 Tax=Angustibacter aerolatus TaxID=1162965 RepID=A0ABQ6JDK5_9ACTN|nr:hypothetical protein GCM10025868_11170 [Angustibacter aerolatus]